MLRYFLIVTMNYLSHLLHLTSLVLIVYLTTIRQCDGRKRHAQRSRRPLQDWYEYSLPSYHDNSLKLREQKLLMEINVSLSGIILALQQRQQQPVYLPVYVPYFMQNNSGYNLSHNGKGEIMQPSKQVFQPSVSKPTKEAIRPTILKPSKEALSPTASKPSEEVIGPTVSKPNKEAFRPTVSNPATAKPAEATRKEQNKPEKININFHNRHNADIETIKATEDNGIESPQGDKSSEVSKCGIATVACCRFSKTEEKKNCFAFYKCSASYDNTQGCSKESIDRAVESVVNAYAPQKRHTLEP